MSSAFVRHNYAGVVVIEQAGVCELYENNVLLARTDNTAIADKLFFKLAFEIASLRVGTGARAQLTTEGKRAFGCVGNATIKEPASLAPSEETTEEKPKRAVFKKPTVEEIADYCREKGYTLTDPQAFYDRHEAGGWMVGRVKMKDWKAAVRTWERKEKAWRDEKAAREKRFEQPRKGVALTNPERSSLDIEGFESDLLHYRPKFRAVKKGMIV